jgi:hypothetical protein
VPSTYLRTAKCDTGAQDNASALLVAALESVFECFAFLGELFD